jgi:hypothetical protein
MQLIKFRINEIRKFVTHMGKTVCFIVIGNQIGKVHFGHLHVDRPKDNIKRDLKVIVWKAQED